MKILGEIGINHNGDIKIAKKLIDICAELKIEAVKFQKRDIYQVYDKDMLSSLRKSPWGETQEDQKKGLEFGQKEYEEINNYCKSKNIKWFASAWDINSLKFLDQFDCEYNKIASAWCNTDPNNSLTLLKQGREIDRLLCEDNPVESHFELGRAMGVQGTPSIVTEEGKMIPGYLPPEDLLNILTTSS